MPDFDEKAFAAALLDPKLPMPDGIADRRGATPEARFAIYRNNVVQSLIEALETGFPAVRNCVGEAFFTAAARLFVLDHPPASPIMARYGEEFPDFLGGFAPCAELPYLADLARIEAARTRAYHAADAETLPAEAFMAIAPADLMALRLTLHPSLFVLASIHPIATIFAMNTGERPPAPIENWCGEDVLVMRSAMRVEIRRLQRGGATFLAGLAEGATLADAASAALSAFETFDLSVALAGLIGFGLAIKTAPASLSADH